MVKQFSFVLRVIGPKHQLLDVGVFFLWRIDLNALWLSHDTGRQGLNARSERGREHHRLMALDGQLIDFSQVIRKAQIKHAVSLVHDQKLNLFKFNVHGALQINQTTWRRDHQVGIL